VSFKIIMTISMTRPCFTTQHQTCKTKTTAYKTKTKTDFLVSDWSCPKTDGCVEQWFVGPFTNYIMPQGRKRTA